MTQEAPTSIGREYFTDSAVKIRKKLSERCIEKNKGGRSDVKGKIKLCQKNYCSSGLAFRSLRTTTTPGWRSKENAVMAALRRSTDRPLGFNV